MSQTEQTTSFPRLWVVDEPAENPAAKTPVPGPLTPIQEAFESLTGWVLAVREPRTNRSRPAPSPNDRLAAEGELVVDDLSPHTGPNRKALDRPACQKLATGINGLMKELTQTRHALRQAHLELATCAPASIPADESKQLEHLLVTLLETASNLGGYQSASLWLVDDDSLTLKQRLGVGPHFEAMEGERHLGDARADVRAMTGNLIVVNNRNEAAKWHTPVLCQAAVCLPVSSLSNLYGTLWLVGDAATELSDRDACVLEIIAGRIACELERASLARKLSPSGGQNERSTAGFACECPSGNDCQSGMIPGTADLPSRNTGKPAATGGKQEVPEQAILDQTNRNVARPAQLPAAGEGTPASGRQDQTPPTVVANSSRHGTSSIITPSANPSGASLNRSPAARGSQPESAASTTPGGLRSKKKPPATAGQPAEDPIGGASSAAEKEALFEALFHPDLGGFLQPPFEGWHLTIPAEARGPAGQLPNRWTGFRVTAAETMMFLSVHVGLELAQQKIGRVRAAFDAYCVLPASPALLTDGLARYFRQYFDCNRELSLCCIEIDPLTGEYRWTSLGGDWGNLFDSRQTPAKAGGKSGSDLLPRQGTLTLSIPDPKGLWLPTLVISRMPR